MANLAPPIITTAWTNSDGTPTLIYWQFMQNLTSQSGVITSLPTLVQVASPSNANAATAGVPVGGIYTTTADPHILYQRTA